MGMQTVVSRGQNPPKCYAKRHGRTTVIAGLAYGKGFVTN